MIALDPDTREPQEKVVILFLHIYVVIRTCIAVLHSVTCLD